MALPDPRAYFSDEEIARARRYHRPGYRRSGLGAAVQLAYLAVLSFTGAGDALADAVGSSVAYVAVVLVGGSLLGMPFRVWGFRHERAWGFAKQSWRAWLNDWAKGAIVGLVVTGGLLVGFLALADALPSTWVFLAAPLAAVVVFVLSFLAPVVFEPLFNKFRPLEDAELADSLRALSVQAGVPVQRRAGRRRQQADDQGERLRERPRRDPAGGHLRHAARSRGSPQEVRLVVAHELGHRRDGHVLKGTLTAALGAVAVAFLVWGLLRVDVVLDAIHATGPGDPLVVPFVLLVAGARGARHRPVRHGGQPPVGAGGRPRLGGADPGSRRVRRDGAQPLDLEPVGAGAVPPRVSVHIQPPGAGGTDRRGGSIRAGQPAHHRRIVNRDLNAS